MSLITAEREQEIRQKNNLEPSVVEKYRLAGQIAQTGLKYVLDLVQNRQDERTVGEICRLGDALMTKLISKAYTKSVREKGLATPVQILKNEFVSGVCPEETDKFQGGYINDGDVVKIVLGVFIDGYTAQAAHTIVVHDNVKQLDKPLLGPQADVMCAVHLATESAVSYLSLAYDGNEVTGSNIRELVETVAKSFNCYVLPGSRIRRIERFLAGQSEAVRETITGVIWDENDDESINKARDDFVVEAGSAWLLDIQMATSERPKIREFTGYGGDVARPSIYSRDYTVQYGLRLNSAKQLLKIIDDEASVYPFKLSSICSDLEARKQAYLGLSELVQHHILLAHPMQRVSPDVKIAREMTTVLLVPSSLSSSVTDAFIRLTGGPEIAAPSWIHSAYQIQVQSIQELLTLKSSRRSTVKYQQVSAMRIDDDESVSMEVDA